MPLQAHSRGGAPRLSRRVLVDVRRGLQRTCPRTQMLPCAAAVIVALGVAGCAAPSREAVDPRCGRDVLAATPAVSDPEMGTARRAVEVKDHSVAGFEGYAWDTPLCAIPGLIRYQSQIVRNSPGKASNVDITCKQEDRKTGACIRFDVEQDIDGEGSYAFGAYFLPYAVSLGANGSVFAAKVFYFGKYARNGGLGLHFKNELKLWGGQYLFESLTIADEERLESQHAAEREEMLEVLSTLPASDPLYAKTEAALQQMQKEEDAYRTPAGEVLDWLIGQYGEPEGFKRRGRVVIQSGHDVIRTPNPPHAQFFVYRWFTPFDGLRPDGGAASITYSCELGVSGACAIVFATQPMYGLAYAEHQESETDFWLYRLLNLDAKQMAQRPTARLCMGSISRCASSQGLTPRERQEFEPVVPAAPGSETGGSAPAGEASIR
jgi:hypothetical protein